MLQWQKEEKDNARQEVNNGVNAPAWEADARRWGAEWAPEWVAAVHLWELAVNVLQ